MAGFHDTRRQEGDTSPPAPMEMRPAQKDRATVGPAEPSPPADQRDDADAEHEDGYGHGV